MCGRDDEYVGINSLTVMADDMPTSADILDGFRSRPNMSDGAVLQQRPQAGKYVVAEDAALRKDRAVGTGRLWVTGKDVAYLKPSYEMIRIIRQEAHPGGRHIDPVDGIGRIIGQSFSDTAAGFEYHDIRVWRSFMLDKMIGDRSTGDAAAYDGDDRLCGTG